MLNIPTIQEIKDYIGEMPVSPQEFMKDFLDSGYTTEEIVEGFQRALEQDHIRLGSGGFLELGSYFYA